MKLQCNDIRKKNRSIENIDVVEVEYNNEEIIIDISYLVRLKASFYFWIQFDVVSLQCNIITYNAMYHILSQTAIALADHLTSNVSMASFEEFHAMSMDTLKNYLAVRGITSSGKRTEVGCP